MPRLTFRHAYHKGNVATAARNSAASSFRGSFQLTNTLPHPCAGSAIPCRWDRSRPTQQLQRWISGAAGQRFAVPRHSSSICPAPTGAVQDWQECSSHDGQPPHQQQPADFSRVRRVETQWAGHRHLAGGPLALQESAATVDRHGPGRQPGTPSGAAFMAVRPERAYRKYSQFQVSARAPRRYRQQVYLHTWSRKFRHQNFAQLVQFLGTASPVAC
jgi:hypothetical protein